MVNKKETLFKVKIVKFFDIKRLKSTKMNLISGL